MDIGIGQGFSRSCTTGDSVEDGGEEDTEDEETASAEDVDDEDADDAGGDGDGGDHGGVGESFGGEPDLLEECGAVEVDELITCTLLEDEDPCADLQWRDASVMAKYLLMRLGLG